MQLKTVREKEVQNCIIPISLKKLYTIVVSILFLYGYPSSRVILWILKTILYKKLKEKTMGLISNIFRCDNGNTTLMVINYINRKN